MFLCVGLSPDLQSMEQIRRIMRPTDVPDTGQIYINNPAPSCTNSDVMMMITMMIVKMMMLEVMVTVIVMMILMVMMMIITDDG